MLVVLVLIIILCTAFIFAVNGRRGQQGLSQLRSWYYAHRGLHGGDIPENSMAAFRAAKEAGYGIELDIHLLQDGTLAVMHDSSLLRTAGAEVTLEELTAEQLSQYRLQGTQERIPLFRDVLELFNGEAPLIIELKSVDNNYNELCQAACDMLDSYEGLFCLESFDPRCIYWLRKNRPDLIRGQLADNFLKTGMKEPWLLRFALRHQLLNILTRPDFIAYHFSERKTISNTIARGIWGIQGVSWTLRTREEFDTALLEGWIPIFEGFRP